jgi:hypothetical protein
MRTKSDDLLGDSLDRFERFKSELPQCDLSTRAHRLAEWKEQVLDNLVSLLKATNDPRLISNVDRAIASSTDLLDVHNGNGW